MIPRKFNSPLDDALAATMTNRLKSAVYAALNHAIDFHEDSGEAPALRKHWKEAGAWWVAENLIASAKSGWPPKEWDFPRIFCVRPDHAQFLRGCMRDDIAASVSSWLEGDPLDPRIDPDPCVEDENVRRLIALHSGLNRSNIRP